MRGMLVALLVLAATPAIADEKLSAVDLSARAAMTSQGQRRCVAETASGRI